MGSKSRLNKKPGSPNWRRGRPAGAVDSLYKEHQETIARTLKTIEEQLKQHAQEQEGAGDWGFVGDLGHVVAMLEEVQEFLSNEE